MNSAPNSVSCSNSGQYLLPFMKLIETTLTHQIAPFDEAQPGPHPVLVLLHGRGANEEDLLGLVPYLDPRLLCVAVRAPFFYPYGGFTWYDLHDIGSPNREQFEESYNRLLEFLDDVQRYYPVDPNQTFLLGFSMGAVIAYSLALTVPAKIKGLVAHSGYVPEHLSPAFQWKSLANTSCFVAHGVYDPVIPIEFGRKAKQLFSKNGVTLEYREYPIQHQISDESLHDLGDWLHMHLKLIE